MPGTAATDAGPVPRRTATPPPPGRPASTSPIPARRADREGVLGREGVAGVATGRTRFADLDAAARRAWTERTIGTCVDGCDEADGERWRRASPPTPCATSRRASAAGERRGDEGTPSTPKPASSPRSAPTTPPGPTTAPTPNPRASTTGAATTT
ncbi:hypothetical protein NKH77_11025 [Streptomyces sp. M19]